MRDAERRQYGSAAEFESKLNRLTERERELLEDLLVGKPLKSIAVRENVTVQTVWRHRGNILQKMGAENDIELVRMAANRVRSE